MTETSERESQPIRDQERVLTIKISLEGPAELISFMRDYSPVSVGRRLAGLLPGEFREHMRAARREQMLAFRSLINAMMGKDEGEERPRRQATRVDVE